MTLEDCTVCVHFIRRGPWYVECSFFNIYAIRGLSISPDTGFEVHGCPLEALSYDVSRKSW